MTDQPFEIKNLNQIQHILGVNQIYNNHRHNIPHQSLFTSENLLDFHHQNKQQQLTSIYQHQQHLHQKQYQTDAEKVRNISLKALQRPIHHINNIKIMIKTQFPIIHTIANKYFFYKYFNKQDHYGDLFLIWVDTYVSEQFIKRLKGYQKINHFPNSCQIGRKDLLGINLNLTKNQLPTQYDFYPQTWILPKQYQTFSKQQKNKQFYIIKPHANCQGRGIYISKYPTFTIKDQVIIQQYIDRPMLIDNCKFDLRIYVLITSISPLKIYIYNEGLCRLATTIYSKPDQQNIKNDKMHLTNYAINKFAPNFVGNKSAKQDNLGHKRSYSAALLQLSKMGFQTKLIQQNIDAIIVKTILACYPKIAKSYLKSRQALNLNKNSKQIGIYKEQIYKNICSQNIPEQSVCFELLGFDIMLLEDGQPILLQVNHQPSLVTDSPLDHMIKKYLVIDTLEMLNIQQKDKQNWQKCQKQGIPYKNKNIQPKGGYRKIYPLQQQNKLMTYYDKIIQKLLYKNNKRFNKIKITNNLYHLKSDIQKQGKQSFIKTNDNSYLINKRTHATRSNGQNQQPVALTFYNLFSNGSVIRASKSIDLPQKIHRLQIDDEIIKNHIIYQNSKIQNIKQFNKNNSLIHNQSPYQIHTSARIKNNPSFTKFSQTYIQKKVRNIRTKSTVQSRWNILQQKQENSSLLLSQNNNFYDLKKKQKLTLNINGQQALLINQSQKKKNNDAPKSQRISQHKPTQKIIFNNINNNDYLKEDKQQVKDVIKQKIQKINNLKIGKGGYVRLNFINFLQKNKFNKTVNKSTQKNNKSLICHGSSQTNRLRQNIQLIMENQSKKLASTIQIQQKN